MAFECPCRIQYHCRPAPRGAAFDCLRRVDVRTPAYLGRIVEQRWTRIDDARMVQMRRRNTTRHKGGHPNGAGTTWSSVRSGTPFFSVPTRCVRTDHVVSRLPHRGGRLPKYSNMSSDDSSTSSSSSILNYAPILPNGHTKRAKQRKMDFFDECLDHTQARAEVQRRMAVVEGGETKKVEEVASSSSQPLESEDSYWARVEQFTVKTAKRRRLDGSDTDEEEMGQWKDGKGWSREQRRGEAVAKWTGGQGGLGLRRTLVPSSTRKVTLFPVFSSREEALTNLTSLLDQLSQRRKGSSSPSEQLLDQLLLRPFIQWIQTSKQLWGRGRHSIYTFLDRNPILSSSRHVDLTCGCESKCVWVLPDLLVQWLWTMACSSLGGTTLALERKCCRIVTEWQNRNGAKRRDDSGSDGWTLCVRPSSLRSDGIVTSLRSDSVQQFQMGDLATGLIHEFGLLLGTTGPSFSILPSTPEDSMQVHPVVDVPSLQRLFLLWIPLLQRDCVVMRNPTDSDGPMGQGATQDLVALARVCLDPHFEMATQR